jgi:hypothetical protein
MYISLANDISSIQLSYTICLAFCRRMLIDTGDIDADVTHTRSVEPSKSQNIFKKDGNKFYLLDKKEKTAKFSNLGICTE